MKRLVDVVLEELLPQLEQAADDHRTSTSPTPPRSTDREDTP